MNISKGIQSDWVHLPAGYLTGDSCATEGGLPRLPDETAALTVLVNSGIHLERAHTGYSQRLLGDRSGMHDWPVYDGVVVRSSEAELARHLVDRLLQGVSGREVEIEGRAVWRESQKRQLELELVC